jgi:hypothetical protein
MSHPLRAALVVVVLGGTCPLAPAQDADAPRVDLAVDGEDLAKVLADLGRAGDTAIVLDPGIEERVRVNLRQIRWDEAVEVVARMTGCRVEKRRGWWRVHQPALVTFSCQDAPVKDALRTVARLGRLDLVIAPDVAGTVSLALKREAGPAALRAVADAAGLQLLDADGCYVLSQATLPAPATPASPSAGPAPQPGKPGARVDVDVEEADLGECLAQIGELAEIDLVLDGAVEETVSLTLRDVPWLTAVDVLAQRTGCTVEVLGPKLLYVSRTPRITLSLDDAPLSQAFSLLGAYAGISMVQRPNLAGRASIRVRDLPWDVAARALAATANVQLQRSADGVLLVAAEPLPPLAAAPPPPALPGDGSKVVAFELTGALELADVMERLGKQVGLNILVDPSVEEHPRLTLRRAGWHDALRALLRWTRCDLELHPGGEQPILLLTQPPKATIQAARAPLAELIALLGAQAGLEVEVTPAVRGEATLDVRDVSAEATLHHVARAHGLRVTRAGDALSVGWSPEAGRLLAAQPPAPAPEPLVVPPPPSLSPEQVAEGTKELEAVFGEIHHHATTRDVEALVERFSTLRAFMEERKAPGVDLVEATLERWRARLTPFGEVLLSIELQVYMSRGNASLERMAVLIRDGHHEAALALLPEVEELRETMYGEEREVFHRGAEATFLRARALADRAERLRVLDKLPLRVSAIALAPPFTDVKNGAIVGGRIAWEGGKILAPDTGRPVPGLRVLELIRSVARFRHEDTEFVRELGGR